MLLFLCGMLALISLFPLLRIGFTDHDTADLHLAAMSGDGLFAYLVELARTQGRFHFIVTGIIGFLPFAFDSLAYQNAVTILSVLLAAGSFAWFSGTVLRSPALGALAMALFLGLLIYDLDHSVVTGYLAYFQIAAAALFLSLLCYSRHLLQRGKAALRASIALYALCTFMNEMFLAYCVLFPFLAWWHRHRLPQVGNSTWRETVWPALRGARFHIMVALVFVALTLGFRQIHGSSYAGNQFNPTGFSLVEYFHALWRLSISALPGYFYFDDGYRQLMRHYGTGVWDSGGPLTPLLGSIQLVWLLRAALIAAAWGLVARVVRPQWSRTESLFIGCLAVLLLFLPHVIMATVPAYQRAVHSGEHISFHLTYFSSFGAVFMITALLGGLLSTWSRGNGRLFPAGVGVAAVALMALSVMTDQVNGATQRAMASSAHKWEYLDRLLASDAFGDVKNGSVLYAPELFLPVFHVYYSMSAFRGHHLLPARQQADSRNYWERYVAARTGRNVTVTGRWLDTAGHSAVYLLRVETAFNGPRGFLVFSRVETVRERKADGPLLISNGAILFPPDDSRLFSVVFSTERPLTGVDVDGVEYPSRGTTHGVQIDQRFSVRRTDYVHIRAEGMRIESMVPLPYPFNGAKRPPALGRTLNEQFPRSEFEQWLRSPGVTIEVNVAGDPNGGRTADRVILPRGATILAGDGVPVRRGDTVEGRIWLAGDAGTSVDVAVDRHCGPTSAEGTGRTVPLDASLREAAVTHQFLDDHKCARLRLVAREGDVSFLAWGARLIRK